MTDVATIARTLEVLAKTLREKGFPKHPLFVQGDPREKLTFFIALWRNEGDREVETVEVQVSEVPQ